MSLFEKLRNARLVRKPQGGFMIEFVKGVTLDLPEEGETLLAGRRRANGSIALNKATAVAVQNAVADLAGSLTPYTDDSFTATQVGIAKAGAGKVDSITCTAGSAVVLTLYDNTQAATGAVIWTGTMTAADVVALTDAYFTNGIYVSYSGTASFVINHSEDL